MKGESVLFIPVQVQMTCPLPHTRSEVSRCPTPVAHKDGGVKYATGASPKIRGRDNITIGKWNEIGITTNTLGLHICIDHCGSDQFKGLFTNTLGLHICIDHCGSDQFKGLFTNTLGLHISINHCGSDQFKGLFTHTLGLHICIDHCGSDQFKGLFTHTLCLHICIDHCGSDQFNGDIHLHSRSTHLY